MYTPIGRATQARSVWEPVAGGPPLAAARAWAADVLEQWRLSEFVDDAQLLLTELASNAMRHGGGLRRIALVRTGSKSLLIAVEDFDASVPVAGGGLREEGGRGLLLVEAIAGKWYAEPTPSGGKRMCAVLATPGGTARAA